MKTTGIGTAKARQAPALLKSPSAEPRGTSKTRKLNYDYLYTNSLPYGTGSNDLGP